MNKFSTPRMRFLTVVVVDYEKKAIFWLFHEKSWFMDYLSASIVEFVVVQVFSLGVGDVGIVGGVGVGVGGVVNGC